MNLILTDVKDIKYRQDSVDSLLTRIQNENEALWKEIATLRHKHQKQQQIVERLIHFLVSLVQSGSIGVKRKGPLMIDNKNGNNKMDMDNNLNIMSSLLNVNSGPIIQEITHCLLDDDEPDTNINSNYDVNSPIITALAETSEPQLEDTTNDSPIFTNQQQQEQFTIQAIENDLKETNVFDPLQESIKAIDDDDDLKNSDLLEGQILDLEAVGATTASLNTQNLQQQQQMNDNLKMTSNLPATTSIIDSNFINPSSVASSDLKLTMPSSTTSMPANTYSTTSLVPSTSSALSTPKISMYVLF